MTRVLVTGSSGFIGSNLTRNLIKTEDQVNILVRKKSNLWRINDVISECNVHQADLLDFEEIRNIISKVKPEIVYHCASFGVYQNQKDITLPTMK